ncbi:hypothetical protein [Salarchaeum sp. JOR-1]|uniref:hypothetical protein n=1 Tax=Salarchaeum sp. JOR-1 TaxID=2599399 RepID=UPI001198A90A|nr:hypothetical protein [Salarchaeum sp. JOR-1]QDX40258.1 hypothetical protein FQU85_04855 [Salarchaeum sp. JOR-1]
MTETLHATRALLSVLCDLAADADPRPIDVSLAATPARDLRPIDHDAGVGLTSIPDDTRVLSDFYFPDAGDSINRVFGMDLTTPSGKTDARFLSHPTGDPSISTTDDLHARLLVGVPPWNPDDVRAYDRNGRRLSLTIVAAETEEEASVLD